MEKCVFHIDVNSAYLSWEAVYRLYRLGGSLDLREIPSAVAGDVQMRHGIILAKSIPAKKYGINTGDSVPEALQKCPDLVLVPPNYGLYERSSKAFMDILKEYTPDVEPYSIDEIFLDMTGTQQLWGTPREAAEGIRERVKRQLGFTVNIGISSNKLLAKMASDFRKPDRVHTLYPSEIPLKMWPLPVSELFFVGRATAGRLLSMGIRTIGELAAADPAMLKCRLKKHGEVIWAYANGMDAAGVNEPPPVKGYGNSTTIAFDVCTRESACKVLLALAETVASRLRRDGVKAGCIAVGIKDSDFCYASHQNVLNVETNITAEIYRIAVKLFDELWDGRPVRHLGIHTGRIARETFSRQLALFDDIDYEKLELADTAIDTIRLRFGMDAVKRAAFLSGSIDHMSGGISREKRSVDYSRLEIH